MEDHLRRELENIRLTIKSMNETELSSVVEELLSTLKDVESSLQEKETIEITPMELNEDFLEELADGDVNDFLQRIGGMNTVIGHLKI